MNPQIKDKIQQRRLQMLIHSCIYYEMNASVISDKQWDEWARELVKLQKEYPEESKDVIWYKAFKDWDASTGVFLPLKDKWVQNKARYILSLTGGKQSVKKVSKPVILKKQQKVSNAKRKLF